MEIEINFDVWCECGESLEITKEDKCGNSDCLSFGLIVKPCKKCKAQPKDSADAKKPCDYCINKKWQWTDRFCNICGRQLHR